MAGYIIIGLCGEWGLLSLIFWLEFLGFGFWREGGGGGLWLAASVMDLEIRCATVNSFFFIPTLLASPLLPPPLSSLLLNPLLTPPHLPTQRERLPYQPINSLTAPPPPQPTSLPPRPQAPRSSRQPLRRKKDSLSSFGVMSRILTFFP